MNNKKKYALILLSLMQIKNANIYNKKKYCPQTIQGNFFYAHHQFYMSFSMKKYATVNLNNMYEFRDVLRIFSEIRAYTTTARQTNRSHKQICRKMLKKKKEKEKKEKKKIFF